MPIISVRVSLDERIELKRKSMSEGYGNLSEYARSLFGLKKHTRDTRLPDTVADGFIRSEQIVEMLVNLVDSNMRHSRSLNRIASILGAPKDVGDDWMADPVKSEEHLNGSEPRTPDVPMGLQLPEGFSVGAP